MTTGWLTECNLPRIGACHQEKYLKILLLLEKAEEAIYLGESFLDDD